MFFVALGAICALGIFGWAFFLHIWHQGDEKAEAFSGLLAFFAAIFSSIVTVVYVYLTNASLLKAQASIMLQQEELEQMKASVDLERREWEQKVRVLPQFWIEPKDEIVWYVPSPQNPGGPHLQGLPFGSGFSLEVWNHSEQSFLISEILLERLDFCGLAQERKSYLQMVVPPHSVGSQSVSSCIARLLTRTRASNKPEHVLERVPDARSRIGIQLVFSDWSQSDAKTSRQEFEIEYRPGDRSVTIRRVTASIVGS